MHRLTFALALLLASPLPARAKATDCLPNPTQACVFQTALRQADDAGLGVLAEGYLAVLYLQEQEHTGDATQTRAALLAQFYPYRLEPERAFRALNGAANMLVWFPEYGVGDQPETDEWLRDTLIDLSRQAGLPAKDYAALKRTPQKAAIRAKVAASPADALPKFARLSTLRGPELMRLDMYIAGLPFALDHDKARLLKRLFAKGALESAGAEIETWTDAKQKANGHAALALAYARAGEIAPALTLARGPELADLTLLDYEAKDGLVEVWARAGARRNDILPHSDTLNLSPEFQPEYRAKIIVAMVMGDIALAHDLLSVIKPWHRELAAISAIEAALDIDPARGPALVALFPRSEQAELLQRLGEAQIQVGDLDGAMATIAQLDNLPDPIYSARLLRSLLAPVLAATGREAEAVQMAADLRIPKVTALVAARLQ